MHAGYDLGFIKEMKSVLLNWWDKTIKGNCKIVKN